MRVIVKIFLGFFLNLKLRIFMFLEIKMFDLNVFEVGWNIVWGDNIKVK